MSTPSMSIKKFLGFIFVSAFLAHSAARLRPQLNQTEMAVSGLALAVIHL
jgi:hypothetical protein